MEKQQPIKIAIIGKIGDGKSTFANSIFIGGKALLLKEDGNYYGQFHARGNFKIRCTT